MANTVMLWLSVEALPVERRELMLALLDWTASVRLLPGTEDARLSEDLEHPGVFHAAAAWRDFDALEAHVGGHGFGALLGAINLLGTGLRVRVGSEMADAHERLRRTRRSVSA